MDASDRSYLSNIAIFHFHDYGRKSIIKTTKIIGLPKRKLIFHPSIFRCCVRFRECKQPAHLELSKKQPTKNQSRLPTSVDIFPSKTRRRVQDIQVAARWCNGPAVGVFLQPTFWREKTSVDPPFCKKSWLNGKMCHIICFFWRIWIVSRFLVDDTFLWNMFLIFFPEEWEWMR